MKNKAVFLPVAIILGLLLGGFYFWSNGPSVAVIKSQQTDVKGASTDEPLEKTVDYDYLSVSIPERFVSKTRTEGMGAPLYIQQLFTVPVKDVSSLFSDQLAITIGILPAAGITDISDVRLRNRDKSYELLQSSEQMLIFEKETTVYEIGVFVKNESNYASLVFSGPQSNKTSLKRELNSSVESIVWR
jgi:nitrogen fixation-related uncharacterized protein